MIEQNDLNNKKYIKVLRAAGFKGKNSVADGTGRSSDGSSYGEICSLENYKEKIENNIFLSQICYNRKKEKIIYIKEYVLVHNERKQHV